MYKYISLTALFFSIASIAFAQQKQFSINDSNNPALRPKGLTQLQWRGDSDTYSAIMDNALVTADPNTNFENIPLLKLDKLNEALKVIGIKEQTIFPTYTWKNNDLLAFQIDNNLLNYNIKTNALIKVNSWNENAENLDIADNGNTAYTIKGNLYVATALTGKTKQVTNDDGYNIVNGESVHRQEFGIVKGTFWNPNATKLAFYRMNQSMVTDFPYADYRVRTATERKIKYPMAGEKSHHVTVGVYDVKKKKIKYLQTGEPAEQYLTNITWNPEGTIIYIQVLNRDQNHMKLNAYDAKSGKFIKTLFEEKDEKYVEPLHGLTFLPRISAEFLYQSRIDGFNHLYIYDINGKKIKQLTQGNWEVLEILGFDIMGKNVYITATANEGLDVVAYKVNLETGEKLLLTNESGVHNIKCSPTGNFVLDSYSNLKTPLNTQVNDKNANTIRLIYKADNPIADYTTCEISYVDITAADGKTTLHARLIKPANFDANKKYPVMHYVYGGPHAQMVQNRWLGGADMFQVYMASQGYVVFCIDNRGSGNRGLAFENATFRQLGTVEMADQMKGIEYLKSLPFVDTSRLGCFGWSFGGFMTTNMMERYAGTFKAAVAGGPVIDWKYYEIMYTERYMDTPQQNPEGFKNASLIDNVDKIQGKLCIIQGLEDDTVVPQHCYTFINECIAKGVLVDFVPYPNHPHNVRGKDRTHLYKKVEDYFKRNL